ncbi:MAG: CopG family transcriptional regulator [Deltaproteobacteria bacterium]|nr:CopG family transcriptional regulator [Deltaproteobacteria bacterium]
MQRMERTQIYLPREQRIRLAAAARTRKTSTAFVIREAVERYLDAEGHEPSGEDGLFDLIGAAGDLDEASDVARSHDRYLAGARLRRVPKRRQKPR